MLVIAAVVLALLTPAIAGAAPASAAPAAVAPAAASSVRPMTLDGWNAGNIISDAVFASKSTMSADQIQNFFNAKVPSCQSGYTCLKDFRVTSQNRPADAYCSGYSGTANESAASIIYRVSQSCNINPQVLIVMLQKEQGLVTHTWPSGWRYDSALGQGCPDDAPCDPSYVGFFQQIYGAARQMQIYMEGRWFTWYAPGNTWNILYNPNQGCGSGPVYIANKATAALYYYTPYQPNPAALRAGYGEGDGCSAYGNRNFYNYFTDWFGSTQAGAGRAALRDQWTASSRFRGHPGLGLGAGSGHDRFDSGPRLCERSRVSDDGEPPAPGPRAVLPRSRHQPRLRGVGPAPAVGFRRCMRLRHQRGSRLQQAPGMLHGHRIRRFAHRVRGQHHGGAGHDHGARLGIGSRHEGPDRGSCLCGRDRNTRRREPEPT